MSFDVQKVRADFPVLAELINGKPLVYLDSANTSQKPNAVIDAMTHFMQHGYAPTNRSAYQLAAEATDKFEGARAKVAAFINAPKVHEVIYTKNATEALNLIVRSWGTANLSAGDAVVLTHMEHHANIVPWQMLCERKGLILRVAPINRKGELIIEEFDKLLSKKTKLLAIIHVSNTLGTINPVKELTQKAHAVGAKVLLDGAQSIQHMKIDVKDLDCDFYVFSSHKVFGPTGIGILWGRSEFLNSMEPFLTGGSMIESATMTEAKWAPSPKRFEAGVPNMAQAVGFAAAIDYLNELGMDNVAKHEQDLTAYALKKFLQLDKVEVIGPKNNIDRGSVISFTIEGIHPHDVGQVLDQYGVAVRTGHHCAWPLMRKLGLIGTTRASFYVYNDEADVDALIDSILEAQKYFKV